jgi:hypothetical protein
MRQDPGLPPGFTLDPVPAPPTRQQAPAADLPPGFTLDPVPARTAARPAPRAAAQPAIPQDPEPPVALPPARPVARSAQGGTPGVSVAPMRRSLGNRFLDAAEDAYRRTIPAALVRMLASGLGDQEFVDPETGERFTYRGIGTQMRERERARREEYELRAGADAWYDRPGILNKMLAGATTLAGGFAGSAGDPTNFLGAGVGGNILRRVGIDAAIGGAQDVAAQGLDIGAGVQDGYNPLQTAASAGFNAFLPAAVEGVGRIANRMLPQAEAPAAPYRVVASEDITAAEADALVASGEYKRDPATGTIYRVVGTEPMPTTTDPFTGATVPEPGGQAAAGAATAPPAAGARVDVGDGAPQVLPRADGGVETLQPDGSIVVSRPDAPDEIIPPARAVEPVEVLLPDGNTAVLPRAAALAEDVGAPGRAPDEVLLGTVVRGLDDEFGIPAQPSAAVARAAEADLTLRAPDEPRAPDARAGNLLLNKFDSTLDVATVLEAADAAAGGFAEARRAPQSFAQTEALAEQLGMTADELLKRPNGAAFNAEQSQAARNLLVASAEKVDAIAARIAQKGDPGEDLLNEFRDTVLRHVAIQEQVAGVVAEAGRALGILRNRASSVNITADMLDAMMAGKGPAGLQRAARNIVEAGKKSPRERAKAIEKAYKATGFDVFLEYWYNSILSGPWTHLFNVLSTGANVLNDLPVTATAAAIGGARRLTGAQWGVERDRVTGTEVYARGVGLLTGAVDGAKAFKHTMMTGGVSDNVDRLDTQVRRAIPGVLGTVIRTPSRLLSAEDEFFKATARRMQLNGIALRMAHAEGLRGDAMTARAAELAKNPTEYLRAEADNFARYLTFQTEMGPGGRAILRVLDAWPASRIVIPFVRTPINLMKTTVEHSPFAPLLTEWRDDVKAGGARADVALAKMAVGMGYGVAIATAAGYGLVTGAAPADKAERDALLATGWQPFSLRIGDRYVDYRRMDPFASILGIAATLGQPQTPHGKPADLASAFVSGFLGQLTDKTFLTGLSDFVVAASDESGNKLEAWAKRFAGSFVPALSAQTAQIIDPAARVTETLPDALRSRIPGMSQDLPARRDILGDPFPTFSPARPVETDPVAQAIVAAGARVGPPSKTVGGRKLTPQEYDDYQRVAGRNLRADLARWVDTQGWRELSDEERREMISDIADRARARARYELRLSE